LEGETIVTEQRLSELLEKIHNVRAAVIGDAALDAYWYADMRQSELSRETPNYNRPVTREVYSGGALANVALNLADLGVGTVSLFTVLGEDWRGGILKKILEKKGLDLSSTLWDDKRFTPTFLKPVLKGYESSQEASRFDFLTDHPPDPETIETLFRSLESSVDRFDCVLVGDQVPAGVMTEELIERLSDLAAGKEKIIFTADSRYRIERFTHMVWKPNEIETARALGMERRPSLMEALEESAGRLLGKGSRLAFITAGPDGCVMADKERVVHIPAFDVPPPFDIVGAGDSFHAAAAASLAAGSSGEEAGILGNLSASVTIRKIDTTGTAAPREILDVFRNFTMRGKHNISGGKIS
jgi:rfaE bifunctional protein kinase chain/domain